MNKSMIIFGLLVCISSLTAQNSATLRLTGINSTTISPGDAISVPVNCDEITPGPNVPGTNGRANVYDNYTASFHVSSDGDDIENALVKVGGQSDTTNAQGIAELLLPDGEHFYTVTKEGFTEANGSFSITGEPVQVEVEMEVCSYVSLHVTSNGGTLTGCTITIGNYVYNNDTASSVCIPAGTYPFSVSKPGYITVSGYIDVPVGPYIINVVLLPMYYEVTFFVNCCGEPLENYPITFEGQTLLTNTAGMAIMVLPSGFYSIVIGGFPVTFTVPDTTSIEVDVCPEITFHVTNDLGNPLATILIEIDDFDLFTDLNGEAVTCLQVGTHTYTAYFFDYEPQSGTLEVDTIPQTIEIVVPIGTYPVTFNCNIICENGYIGWFFSINGISIEPGETIYLPAGPCYISSGFTDCFISTVLGNINYSGLYIECGPFEPHVTFHVSSALGGNLLGAIVEVDTFSLITNYDGDASFCLPGGDFNYSVTKEGYGTFNGIFTYANPCEDTIVEILMDPVSVNDHNSSAFRLYPNPSGGLFYLENLNRALNMTEITIQDITGRIVYYQETATGDKVEIDLKSHPKGMYFIRAKAGEELLSKKLVIQ